MEKIIWNKVQLDFFSSTRSRVVSAFLRYLTHDKLPHHPHRGRCVGYMVNTDPLDKPGKHWLAL